jgi:hypothetical protein
MNDFMIPIALALCIVVILISHFYFSYKNKNDVQLTIRDALNKGSELSPEHIAQMSRVKSSKEVDLRRGIILLCLGFAIVLAGLIIGSGRNAAALAMFPMLLGCGFIMTWKLNKHD